MNFDDDKLWLQTQWFFCCFVVLMFICDCELEVFRDSISHFQAATMLTMDDQSNSFDYDTTITASATLRFNATQLQSSQSWWCFLFSDCYWKFFIIKYVQSIEIDRFVCVCVWLGIPQIGLEMYAHTCKCIYKTN